MPNPKADFGREDACLREMFGQLDPPEAPPELLGRSVRSATRAGRLASLGSTRRGFAWGAVSASAVCAVLALAIIGPGQLDVGQLGARAGAWLDDSSLIASSESGFWSDAGEGGDLAAGLNKVMPSQVLNLTTSDIRAQDVSTILTVPVDLHDAVVRISLDSGIELRDLPGLSVVEWKSDFVQGSNVLNLSLATIDDSIDRFNSVRVRVSHPEYSSEIWINIAREELPGF